MSDLIFEHQHRPKNLTEIVPSLIDRAKLIARVLPRAVIGVVSQEDELFGELSEKSRRKGAILIQPYLETSFPEVAEEIIQKRDLQ